MILNVVEFTNAGPALPSIKPQIVGNSVALLTIRGVCDFVTEAGLERAAYNLRMDPAVKKVVARIDSDLTTCNAGELWPSISLRESSSVLMPWRIISAPAGKTFEQPSHSI